MRVPYDELYAALRRATLHLGLQGDRAALCARLFAETTRDGVYTHGLERFPRFADMVANGCIDVNAEPARVSEPQPNSPIAIERWNGNLGPGNLNAWSSMQRALALARQHGIGCVALANTNHWMRGGSYGWQAADAGCFAVCWTNTLANVPPWGASTVALGNNPLVLAVPRPAGAHVVLDMAMSQFSYGTLSSYSAKGAPLPVPGGYDLAGNLTTDSAAIEASKRALPIGYWKGAGLSLLLDLFAASLAGGRATHDIPLDPNRESGTSQIFLAIDPAAFADHAELDRIAGGVLESLHDATPLDPARPVRYPGEQTLRLREENLRLGVPVNPATWQQLTALAF